jgi:hypothetical protein
MLRATLVWLLIVPVAILNGALRSFLLVPLLGGALAHIVSTLILSAVVVLIAYALLRPVSAREAWRMGAMWLALTITFEFLAGHWVFQQSWERLLADYNITRGRVWILVLIATFIAPMVAWRMRGSRSHTTVRP